MDLKSKPHPISMYTKITTLILICFIAACTQAKQQAMENNPAHLELFHLRGSPSSDIS